MVSLLLPKGSKWALGCINLLNLPDDSGRMRVLTVKVRAKVLDLVSLLDPIGPIFHLRMWKIVEILMSLMDI